MASLKKILVGVDYDNDTGEFPVPTQQAINKAIWLASGQKAELTFFSVLLEEYADSEIQIEGAGQDDPRAAIEALLTPYLDKAKENGVTASSKTVVGRGWLELTKEVIREKHDLLIVGTREKTAAQKMLYGSTGTKLLRKCPCPVWITRPDVDPLEVSTIVAAVDTSPVGEKIIEAAVTAAQLINSRLLIVHAIKFPLEGSLKRTECSSEEIDAYREKVRSEAEQLITERLAQTDYRTLDQGTLVRIVEGPADTIVEEAVIDENADLLVMGTLGRGGIPGFLLGNTAERLLPKLRCSLLAIKPDDFVSPVKTD